MVAAAAAADRALPEYVPACMTPPPAQVSITACLPPTAATGKPFPIALAKVPRSGVTPKTSSAPPRASRNPVFTSSKMSRQPYSSASRRRPSR